MEPTSKDPLKYSAPVSVSCTPLGAYFGASLASIDLNNDRHDDIIIGSPMYQDTTDPDRHDLGRIDIYIRQHNNKNKIRYVIYKVKLIMN